MPTNLSPEPFIKEGPDPAEFKDARLAQLLVHWNGLLGDGPLPPATAIDPNALKFILGWLMIIDPVEGGGDFNYRLYGSSIAETTGRDLTGCRVSDSFPKFAVFAIAVYRAAMDHRRPVLTRHTPPRLIGVAQWERLILPFAGPDGAVMRFLVGAVPLGTTKVEKRRLPWPLRDHPKE